MPNANRLFLWLLGVLLLGGVAWYAWWFTTNFEQRSKEVRVDISPEARKNRYLAAEHFLRQIGQSVQSHAGRDIFSLNPSVDDVIFLGSNSGLFLKRNHDELSDWVKAGGQLILTPDASSGEEGEGFVLLEQLGVELVLVDEQDTEGSCDEDSGSCDEEAAVTDSAGEEADDSDGDEIKKVTVSFRAEHAGDFKAAFLADRYLNDTQELAEVVVGTTDSQAKLLRYSVGNGSVTVLSDTGLFRNDAIGELDHAYLLHQLLYTSGKVWIFYSADMPSLLMLLWQRAPYLSLIVITLLLMAGWLMLLNSGPRLKPQHEPRRNLLEHLDSTAEYSWRIDKARQLFADNRHAVEQAWRRRYPQLNIMEQAARCEWIGEKCGITTRAVERTLYGEIASEQDFIKASAVLQRLAVRVKGERWM